MPYSQKEPFSASPEATNMMLSQMAQLLDMQEHLRQDLVSLSEKVTISNSEIKSLGKRQDEMERSLRELIVMKVDAHEHKLENRILKVDHRIEKIESKQAQAEERFNSIIYGGTRPKGILAWAQWIAVSVIGGAIGYIISRIGNAGH